MICGKKLKLIRTVDHIGCPITLHVVDLSVSGDGGTVICRTKSTSSATDEGTTSSC